MKYWYNEKLNNYPHSVIAEHGNADGLFKMTKAAVLKDEITEWLEENLGSDYTTEDVRVGLVRFNSEESAMAFILRWS